MTTQPVWRNKDSVSLQLLETSSLLVESAILPVPLELMLLGGAEPLFSSYRDDLLLTLI